MSYINTPHKNRIELFRRALTVGLGAQLIAAPALLAQSATEPAPSSEPIEMDRVIITGSLIPTDTNITGVNPVSIFDAVELQQTGNVDLGAALRRLSPDFQGNGNVGSEANNGGGGESTVALRNLPTLVLLNGQRLAGSAFSNGATVDVNTIPASMIERIEVLKDGSSVLYGSQAVGGVVNIITKKNFNGAEMGGQWGFATQEGTFNQNMAYVTAGASSDKASFVAGVQHFHSDPLLTADRQVASYGLLDLVNRNIAPPTYVSPSLPGRVQDPQIYNIVDGQFVADPTKPATSYMLAGSPFSVGAPGYKPGVNKPPVFPGVSFPQLSGRITNIVEGVPVVTTRPIGAQSVAAYNAYAKSQLGYEPYVPIKNTQIGQVLAGAGFAEGSGWPLLNTTQLNTHSIQSQDRNNAFANGSYELFDKRMELTGSFLYMNSESTGALAPSPVPSLDSYGIVVAADDPNNPFQTELGSAGNGNPRVRSRFQDAGNRTFTNQNDYYQFVGGLQGELDNQYFKRYTATYNYNRNDQLRYQAGGINGILLQDAFTPNSDPNLAALGLSNLTDAGGNFVPVYNIFALPGQNSAQTIQALSATGLNSGISELWNAQGTFGGDLFELPGGTLSYAAGGGYASESIALVVDGLLQANQLIGYNGDFSTPGGTRDNGYGFVEVKVPITGPTMDIPALHALEVTAGGRYDTYSPGGSKTVPQVGVRWQPIDEQVTLRGTYSESFVAPTVFNLYGAPQTSFDTVGTPDGSGQVQMSWTSSPLLVPSDAKNYGVGIVLVPDFAKGLAITCDYYKVTTENDVTRVGAQAVADSLNALGSDSPYAETFTFADGTRLTSNAPNQVTVADWGVGTRPLINGAQQETEGFDLTATYALPTDKLGRFTFNAAANVLMNYYYSDPAIGGPYQYAGQFTDNGPAGGAQGTLPDFVLTTGLAWEFMNLTYVVSARYIPSVEDLGSTHPSYAPNDPNEYTIDGTVWSVQSWFTVDMQISYLFKSPMGSAWYDGTRLAVGAQNVSNNEAVLIASSSEDNTDKSTYDIVGRFIYFQISKKF